MSVTPAHVLLLLVSGLLGGAVNAAAGGGSLISFPALLAAGLPALSANVTNTVALCPGYFGGVSGFRTELLGQRPRMKTLGTSAACGAVLGVALLQMSPASTFHAVVPFLLLVGSLLLAFQPPIARGIAARRGSRDPSDRSAQIAVFGAGAYGAYFGAGLGVILLGVLGVLVAETLPRLNGLKAYLTLLVNTVAAVLFIAVAPISWPAVLLMAPSCLVGGRLGASLSRRVAPGVLRATVVSIGLTVAIALLAEA